MNANAETADRVLILLDETQPAMAHALIRAAFERITAEGHRPVLLCVPCPSQPSHPMIDGTGPYQPWATGPFPEHAALLATSCSTAILGAAWSAGPVHWLLGSDPFADAGEDSLDGEIAHGLMREGGVHPLASSASLGEILRSQHGLDASVYALVPAFPEANAIRPDPPRPRVVIDHTSRSGESVVRAAEAIQGLDLSTVLLTDLLDPPWASEFGEKRIRPRDRQRHYAGATLVLKLDGFHASLPALAAILASGAPLAATRDAVDALPLTHLHDAWILSSPAPDPVRAEIALLTRNRQALASIARRGRQKYESWRALPGGGTFRFAAAQLPAPSAIRELAAAVLMRANRAAWNSTILRRLNEWYDGAAGCGEVTK